MKLDTVNVVEYNDDTIIGITSFQDDEEGNKEAEDIFKRCAKEHGATEEDLEAFILEDGYYETGGYQIFLVHSE